MRLGVIKNTCDLVGDLLLSMSALYCPRQHLYVPDGTSTAVNIFHCVNIVTTALSPYSYSFADPKVAQAVIVGRHGWLLTGDVVSAWDSQGS